MANPETDPDAPSTYKTYGDPPSKKTPQTVFPKAEGTQGAAPPAAPVDPDAPSTYKPYGDKPKTAAASSADDSLSWYNVFHPKPADLSRPQTWTDWMTKTYSPSASDVGRATLDDASFGYADPIRAKITGENVADLRARTADAQAAMGPMGPVVNGLTYAVPGMGVARGLKAVGAAGKVTGAIGRYGAGALEGGTASGASSIGHQIGDPNHPINYEKTAKETALGAGFGVGGQVAGDVAAATAQRVADFVKGMPGRSGEAWNWRTRADDPTLPGDVANQQTFRAPDDPAQPGLAKLQTALAQSTEPGRAADAIYAGAGTLGGYFGVPPDYALLGGIGGLTAGGVVKNAFGSPGARAINTVDRNINVGQAMDQLYPAIYPQKGPSTTDTSGWADALRQFTIGSEARPGPPGSQFW